MRFQLISVGFGLEEVLQKLMDNCRPKPKDDHCPGMPQFKEQTKRVDLCKSPLFHRERERPPAMSISAPLT